jgi:fatty-acid desaturase
MTKTVAALVWFAGLVGWYIIRHPFERKAKKIGVRKSLLDWRERSLLAIALLGLFVIPAIYVLTGFPASLDRPFVPVVAWLGLAPLVGALWLFRRSHALFQIPDAGFVILAQLNDFLFQLLDILCVL